MSRMGRHASSSETIPLKPKSVSIREIRVLFSYPIGVPFPSYTSSRMRSEATVRAIFSWFGWPLARDFAKLIACSGSTFAG
jgi:hypothetical protein